MTIFRTGLLAIAGAVTAVLMSFGATSAFAVTCPDPPAAGDRIFTIDVVGASCLNSGPGNIQGDNNDFPGYVYLDKWSRDESPAGALTGSNENGYLTAILESVTKGTFSFAVAGFTNFVIGFKSGNAGHDPDWAGFTLPNGTTSGGWTITGWPQGLSHINLYGQIAAVPVPAGVLLLGSALGGLGLFSWRKNRKAKLAA